MQRATDKNVKPRTPKVKAVLTPAEVQARISKLTGKYVAGMIRALSLYHGRPQERFLYAEFRRNKRKLYELYPDDPKKAKAFCNFALVKAGWSGRGRR